MQQEIEKLRESEEKYRKMIEMANDAILTIDIDDATIVEVNPRAEEMTGYSARELVGRKVWELHPKTEEEQTHRLFKKVVESGKGHLEDLHFVRKDGSQVVIEVSASVIEYGKQRVIQRICRDITRRHESEQETTYLHNYYESILEMMPIGLGVRSNIGASPKVEFENKRLKSMFEQARQDGCDCGWEESAEADSCCKKPILNPNGVYAEERTFPGGKTYQFTLNYFQHCDRSWRELQIVEDVTRRRELEEKLRQAMGNLEQKVKERTKELSDKQTQLVQAEKMAALGNLVAGIAHEINTPLGALKSNYDLFGRSLDKMHLLAKEACLPETTDLTEKTKQLFEKIKNLNDLNKTAIERVARIVTSLRSFARLDRAEKDTVDIHVGIDGSLTLVNHQLKGRIEVIRDYGNLPAIDCYPNQLNQVFMNLLVNAGHAIESSGEIRIKTRKKGNDVTIEISDSGVGMSEDIIKQIFDPGFTTKGRGVGTGLGLSIVHQIIAEHHGKIEVDSKKGEGATFRLTLPIK